MSQKTYTERELRLAERKAYIHGVEDRLINAVYTLGGASVRARTLYPMPMIARPRVVHCKTKGESPLNIAIVDGRLKYSYWEVAPHWDFLDSIQGRSDFCDDGVVQELKENLDIFLNAYSELKANPTELVEDDA